MLYLSDELYKQKGKHIRFTVGTPILYKTFAEGKADEEVAQNIKETVYNLEESNVIT